MHICAHSVRNTLMPRLRQMSAAAPRWHAGPLTLASLVLATELFADKPRKGSSTPYLSHLLAVSALVMEHGGTEAQAAAGLLHDVLEDTGMDSHSLSTRLVAAGAGLDETQLVVQIVEASTDGAHAEQRDGSTWPTRKAVYLDALRSKASSDPAMLVSLADKVHNIEATLREVRKGTSATSLYDAPWFNAKAPAQKWYYTSLAVVFREKLDTDREAVGLVQRLESAVGEIFSEVPLP